MTKRPTSYRLSNETKRQLDYLAKKNGETVTDTITRLAAEKSAVELMVTKVNVIDAINKLLARGHYECEDRWYSCPMVDDYWGPIEDDDKYCNCGKEELDESLMMILEYVTKT